jgi:hypothetical protein
VTRLVSADSVRAGLTARSLSFFSFAAMSLKDRAALLGNRLEALKGGRANTASVSMTNRR